jgi:hypothetical protein
MSGPNAPPINPQMIGQILQNPQVMQMIQQIAPQLVGGGGGPPPDMPPPGGESVPPPAPPEGGGAGGPPSAGGPPQAMLQALQGRMQGG